MVISSKYYSTPRINIYALQNTFKADKQTILFLHGNASSSIFWKEIMEFLIEDFNVVAPDLRGYGKTEDKLIDATKGYSDQSEDVIGLLDEIDVDKFHVVGHSMGGGVVYDLLINHSPRIRTATLVNPVSPYGFGGTKGKEGIPCNDDFAGTGAGSVNPEFAERIAANDRSEENPNASPRVVMNAFYWKPPFRAANEDELLEGLLEEKIGNQKYPGDSIESKNWPLFAPGKYGPVNAASPKYNQNLAQKLIQTSNKPPVLWVRGSDDLIVSNNSLFDIAVLGKMGLIPGYPGEEEYPPQQMVEQTRFVLKEYAKNGGFSKEVEINDTGHTPFIEKPDVFLTIFNAFVKETS